MSRRPHILVTNDDGVFAPGIRHLWQALKDIADLTVVAPSIERSAVGLSLTIRDPLRVEKVQWSGGLTVYSVSGTPADCVKLGISVIVDRPIDLVVSGVNRGTNAGRNIFYSGTVGAAIEAVLHGIPGIAFSCYDFETPNYIGTEESIGKVVEYIFENPLADGTILNVNFPSKIHSTIKGFKLTRQGKEIWMENPDKRFHPMEGHVYYWLGAKLQQNEEELDCDSAWLNQGYITAVPVYVGELTHHQHLDFHRTPFENRMNGIV
jgi:5'-nucleotidase